MPRLGIALESIEHLQSVHARHVYVERYRIRTDLTRRLEARFSVQLDHALVTLVSRHVEQNFREVLIVLDDEDGTIAFLDVLPVILDDSLRHGSALGRVLQRVARRLAALITAWSRISHRRPRILP